MTAVARTRRIEESDYGRERVAVQVRWERDGDDGLRGHVIAYSSDKPRNLSSSWFNPNISVKECPHIPVMPT
jgi:hypothetical protein